MKIKGVREDFNMKREGKPAFPEKNDPANKACRGAGNRMMLGGAWRSVTWDGRQPVRDRLWRRDRAGDAEDEGGRGRERTGAGEGSGCSTWPGERWGDGMVAPGEPHLET